MLSQEFELGSYTGQLEDGVPHGLGQMVYREEDALEREIYDGQWSGGCQSGQGSMKFRSGEIYSGTFLDNLPHGRGEFLYPNGDREEVSMEGGVRQGQSRYTSAEDGSVEELLFSQGQPEGPSKVSSAGDLTSSCLTNNAPFPPSSCMRMEVWRREPFRMEQRTDQRR